MNLRKEQLLSRLNKKILDALRDHPSLKGLSRRTINRRIAQTRKEIGTYHSQRAAGAYYAAKLGIDVYKLLQDKPEEIGELRKIGTIPARTTPPPIKRRKSPKKRSERVYPKGHVYDFYRDIQSIIRKAKKEVFLIDSYADEEILDLYLAKMPKSVEIRILTKEPKGNFIKVARKFKMKPNIRFEARKSQDCHDRLFFIDDQCWISGQSVKDAGKKPTYLVKIDASEVFKKVFDELWKNSTILV